MWIAANQAHLLLCLIILLLSSGCYVAAVKSQLHTCQHWQDQTHCVSRGPPIISCPSKSVTLQNVVAHVLLAPELLGVLCSFDWLITPLLGLGGGGVSDNFVKTNHDLLVSAFRYGEHKYILPYLDLIHEGGSDAHSSLFVRVAQRKGKSGKVYKFGRFSSASDSKTIPSAGSRDSMLLHPLDQSSVKRLLDRMIPQNVKDDLRIFLWKERNEQKKR